MRVVSRVRTWRPAEAGEWPGDASGDAPRSPRGPPASRLLRLPCGMLARAARAGSASRSPCVGAASCSASAARRRSRPPSSRPTSPRRRRTPVGSTRRRSPAAAACRRPWRAPGARASKRPRPLVDVCARPGLRRGARRGDDGAAIAAAGGGEAFRVAVATGHAPCVSLADPGRVWAVVNKTRPSDPVDFRPSDSSRRRRCATSRGARCGRMPRPPSPTMASAARAAGAGEIALASGFRSYATQRSTYQRQVASRGARRGRPGERSARATASTSRGSPPMSSPAPAAAPTSSDVRRDAAAGVGRGALVGVRLDRPLRRRAHPDHGLLARAVASALHRPRARRGLPRRRMAHPSRSSSGCPRPRTTAADARSRDSRG